MSLTPHPGEIIRDELDARSWSQRDLAYVLGVPETTVTLLLSGKRGISAEMARALGDAFDVSAEFFVRLQAAHDLTRARAPDRAVALKGRLQSAYPVREMIKRGWFAEQEPEVLEPQFKAFFQWSETSAHAAKKKSYEEVTPAELAWVSRVRQIAGELQVSKYTTMALRKGLPRIRALMSSAEEARNVPRVLGELGVRFVVVEVLLGSKIDGVCLWLDKNSPVIGVSMRFDRIDNFWFVLGHELAHVLAEHGQSSPMIDKELEGPGASVGDELPEEERFANKEAQAFCVPSAAFESFMARKAPYFSEKDLLGFSAKLGVHPGIVAGQLRRRTNNWKIFTKYLVKVRASVASCAVVDGWGEVVRTESQ